MATRKGGKSTSALVKPAAHVEGPVCTILLVLALPEERDYIYDRMDARQGWRVGLRLNRDRCRYDGPNGPVQVVVQVLDGMGPIEAVLGTTSAIAAATPDLVVMVGIAGALDHGKVGLGDVVISTRAKLYSPDKVATPGATGRKYRFEDEPGLAPPRPADEVWVDRRDRFMSKSFVRYQRDYSICATVDDLIASVGDKLRATTLRQLSDEMVPKKFVDLPTHKRARQVLTGWLLGSNHVVDSAEYRAYLVDKNRDLSKDIHTQTSSVGRSKWIEGDLLAVDMESYGLLRVVNDTISKPPAQGGTDNLIGGLIVRGISDLCEGKADLDGATENAVRRLAVDNAIEIGFALIEGLDHAAILRNRA